MKQRIKGRAEIREPKHLNVLHDITVSHCIPQNNLCMNRSLFVSFHRCQWPKVLKDCPSSHTNSPSCYLTRQVKGHSQPLECLFTVTSHRRPLRTTLGWLAPTVPPALSPWCQLAAGQTVRVWAMPGGRSNSERSGRGTFLQILLMAFKGSGTKWENWT